MEEIRPPQRQSAKAPPPPNTKNVGGVSFVPKETAPQIEEGTPDKEEVRRELERAGVETEQKQGGTSSKKTPWKTSLRSLRTYKDDIASILKKAGTSKISIQAAQVKKEKSRLEEEEVRRKEEVAEAKREEELKMQEEKLHEEEVRRQQKEEARRRQEAMSTEDEAERKRQAHEEDLALKARQQEETADRVRQAQEKLRREKEQEETSRLKQKEKEVVATQKVREEQERIREEQTKIRNARESRREDAEAQPTQLANEEGRHKRIGTIAVIFLFILLGSGALFGAYSIFFTEKTPPLKLSIDTLVLAEKNIDVDVTNLTNKDIVAQLTQAKYSVKTQQGTIVNFRVFEQIPYKKDGSFAEQEVPTQPLLEALAPDAPETLTRSFGDAHMLGLYVSPDNHRDMFLILKPTFYENAFASMLSWEKNMPGDLSSLFGVKVESENANSMSTSTPPSVSQNIFEDKVIKNKDTRILTDKDGKLILLYSFVDRNTLIITSSKASFLEIFKRLSSKRISR